MKVWHLIAFPRQLFFKTECVFIWAKWWCAVNVDALFGYFQSTTRKAAESIFPPNCDNWAHWSTAPVVPKQANVNKVLNKPIRATGWKSCSNPPVTRYAALWPIVVTAALRPPFCSSQQAVNTWIARSTQRSVQVRDDGQVAKGESLLWKIKSAFQSTAGLHVHLEGE